MASGLLILALAGIVTPQRPGGEAVSAIDPSERVERQDRLAAAHLALNERQEELAERDEQFRDESERYGELLGLEVAGLLTYEQQTELTALRRSEWELVAAGLRVEVAERETEVAELRLANAEQGAEGVVPTRPGFAGTLAAVLTPIMQAIISLLVLLTALYELRARENPPQWAAAFVGAVLGYWLPG